MPSTAARLILLALLLITPFAHAERADRDKPVTIESDRFSADDRNKVQIFEGRVKLVQGTLELLADKMVVTQDAEGFQKGVATGGKDGLARFKQKREGKNEYIEGEAERIEYNGRGDKAKLFVRAMTRSGLDEARGQYIEYDGYNELYTVTSGPDASVSKNPNDRARAVYNTKSTQPEAAVSRPAAGKP